MKAAQRHPSLSLSAALGFFLSVLISLNAGAATQLLLSRDGSADRAEEYKGVIEVTIDPGVEDAKVAVTVDGQKLADALRSPYKLMVDFGPMPIEHKITEVGRGGGGCLVGIG